VVIGRVGKVGKLRDIKGDGEIVVGIREGD
jgi:hypothetical protein